jgi:hypothetical protein
MISLRCSLLSLSQRAARRGAGALAGLVLAALREHRVNDGGDAIAGRFEEMRIMATTSPSADIQRQIRHPALRWMAATLDGRVEATGAVFEAKFMLPWSFSEEAAAEKYMPQLQQKIPGRDHPIRGG